MQYWNCYDEVELGKILCPKKKHSRWTEYKGHDLIEIKNIVLNPLSYKPKPDRFCDHAENAIKQAQNKLQEINNTISPDSLEMIANRDELAYGRYKLPNGYEYELEVDSSNFHEFDDNNGGSFISYARKPDPLKKYVSTLGDIHSGIRTLFTYIDVRNRSIDFLFSNDFLGNCRGIVTLKPAGKHSYILLEDQFTKKWPLFFTITVDDNDNITDVVYSAPDY